MTVHSQACGKLELLEAVVMVGLGAQDGHTVLRVVGVRQSNVIPDQRQYRR
jgi:hypothetical protein